MSALNSKNKKEIKDLVVALNCSNDLGFKYPIGNKELTLKIKEFESIGYIEYNDKTNKWNVTRFIK